MICLSGISPRLFSIGLAMVAVAALASVFIGQYFFGLHPCHLCIYQRWPFAVIIILGLAGWAMPRISKTMIVFSGAAFLVNAGIALYHSGVERKWWVGLEGCSTPDMSGSIEDLMARIESTAVTRCDEIAWSLFGLSLANYNVLLCVAGGAAALAYLMKCRCSRSLR